MATSFAPIAPQKPLEDPLAHLPCSGILEYSKGQIIYSPDQPPTGIYLVIDGKVKISRLAADGQQVLVDIYQNDEFFGESAFLNLPQRSEQATAFENTKLMTWTGSEIEDIVLKRPKLAVALLQMIGQRSVEFTHRIESFSVDNLSRRLARLTQFLVVEFLSDDPVFRPPAADRAHVVRRGRDHAQIGRFGRT